MYNALRICCSVLLYTHIVAGVDLQTRLIRFNNPTNELLKQCIRENRDIAGYNQGEFLDLVISEEEYNGLLARKEPFTVRSVFDQQASAAVPGYKTYDEIVALLKKTETDNPGICRLYDIGDSRGKQYVSAGIGGYSKHNHDIWALKISDNVNTEEDEPSVFFFGGHHAREIISAEVPLALMQKIVTGYATDQRIKDAVNATQIWFVPLVNPDGYTLAQSGSYKNWRKNIRDNNDSKVFDELQDGVDPNRNYPYKWGGAGSSPVPGNEVYHGPSAASEPEIQAMQNLFEQHHFVAGIAYHSYSELVLYPYAYLFAAKTPDYQAIDQLAAALAQTLRKIDNTGYYKYGQVSKILYEASGGTEDFAYGMYGVINFTVEMGLSFAPTGDTIQKLCNDNLAGALLIFDRLKKSMLTGHLTGSPAGSPLEAAVYIKEIDDTIAAGTSFRYPYKSDR